MTRTRRVRRVERTAVLTSLLQAALAAAVALAITHDRARLIRLAADVRIPADVRPRVISIGAAVAVAIAGVCAVVATWHAARWVVACRQERQLRDSARSPLVPPLPEHLAILPSASGLGTISGVALAGAGFAALAVVWRSGELACYGALCFAGATSLVVDRHRERRAEQLSRQPTSGAGTAPVPVTGRATTIPPLEVSFWAAESAVEREMFLITSRTNALGGPPWNIAYLRLFHNEPRLQAFLASAWAELGYIHFIRAAGSVTRAEIKDAAHGRRLFISSRAALLTELNSGATEPMPRAPKRASPARPGIEHRPSAGSVPSEPHDCYPTRALLCHETYWKSALDVLLERMDVVVLDLSGYQRSNLGTGYELQRTIDRFPIHRCVFLADPRSDQTFLTAQIRQGWSRMADGSPNSGDRTRTLIVARVSQPARAEVMALATLVRRRRELAAPL